MELIKNEYLNEQASWYIGFSGGKDSTATVKLVCNSLLKIRNPQKSVNIIYCDTGVEIPIIDQYVINMLNSMKEELLNTNLPIQVKIVEPKLEDRFFSKVIGKGYPTPTNIFRWCTRRLRIYPIQALMKQNKSNVVIVGVRKVSVQ